MKPSNLVVQDSLDPDAAARGDVDLCLIDFGLCGIEQQGTAFVEACGTVAFMAPEQFEGEYNKSADIWSAGILLHVLLSGELPFEGSTGSH